MAIIWKVKEEVEEMVSISIIGDVKQEIEKL
jgi:hypothetical protein